MADGVTTFIEVGPGGVLSGLIRKIDRSISATCVHDPRSLEAAEATLRAQD